VRLPRIVSTHPKQAAGAAGAALALAAVGVLAMTSASSTSTAGSPPDGAYSCAFATDAVDCTAAPLPTVTTTQTQTATVTDTTTVTQTPTPTPSPTPTPTTAALLTGTSLPGLGVFPDADVVREFWSGLPSATFAAAPAGAAEVVSFKTVPTASVFGADLDAWAATGRTVYWTWHHEPDNGDMTGPAYVTQMNALLAIASIHPHPNVHSATVLTAGALANGSAESYYVPAVDVLGFDCYTLSNEPKALAYAVAKGKPLIFPEVGDKTTGQTNSDAEALAYAQAFWPALTPNVRAAVWWSGSTDTLVGKPDTTAYLRAR
jgi:hypothetical protein